MELDEYNEVRLINIELENYQASLKLFAWEK